MKNKSELSGIIFRRSLFFVFLSFLAVVTSSFPAVDLTKEIAALKEEIKGARGKIDKAEPGQTLETINMSASIVNIRRVLESLSQKAGNDKKLSDRIKNLSDSLKTLDGAKKKNDKPGTLKILNEMMVVLSAIEKDMITLQSATIKGQRATPATVDQEGEAASGGSTSGSPVRIDFEGFHEVTVPPPRYTPGPAVRIDFEGFHEVTAPLPRYTPGPPVRIDFEGFRARE
jgi:hypothetical protein